MNCTIKDATVNRFFYQNHTLLEQYLDIFICLKSWSEKPSLFLSDPSLLFMDCTVL